MASKFWRLLNVINHIITKIQGSCNILVFNLGQNQNVSTGGALFLQLQQLQLKNLTKWQWGRSSVRWNALNRFGALERHANATPISKGKRVCRNEYFFLISFLFRTVGFDGKALMVLVVGTYSAKCLVYCWNFILFSRARLYSSFHFVGGLTCCLWSTEFTCAFRCPALLKLHMTCLQACLIF